MKIILDAMGGDNAPLCNVQGALDAVKASGVEVILVGDGERLLECLRDLGQGELPHGLEISAFFSRLPLTRWSRGGIKPKLMFMGWKSVTLSLEM